MSEERGGERGEGGVGKDEDGDGNKDDIVSGGNEKVFHGFCRIQQQESKRFNLSCRRKVKEKKRNNIKLIYCLPILPIIPLP